MIDVDLKKVEAGAEEMYKIAVNWAEVGLIVASKNMKEECSIEGKCADEIYSHWESSFRRIGRNSYDEKTEAIQNHVKQDVRKKYEIELNKLIDSKIEEVRNYKPKTLEEISK